MWGINQRTQREKIHKNESLLLSGYENKENGGGQCNARKEKQVLGNIEVPSKEKLLLCGLSIISESPHSRLH